MRLDGFFRVTDQQRVLFRKMLQVLRVGQQVNLRRLRRFCSGRRDRLEEEEEAGWPESKAEEKQEELRIFYVMEFMYAPLSLEEDDVEVQKFMKLHMYFVLL